MTKPGSGGEIAKAIYRIKQLMDAMNALDQKIVQADSIIAQGASLAKKQLEQAKLPAGINSSAGALPGNLQPRDGSEGK